MIHWKILKNPEDARATLEALNRQIIDALGELLNKYDDDFEKGNKKT